MMASGMKQRLDGSLWEGMLYKAVVSVLTSLTHTCRGKWRNITELARLENLFFGTMYAAGVTGPVLVNMVLLDPPNSSAHQEKQGVELGIYLSILQGPSLPHY